MSYILLSIVLFSFNNVLWKKNLEKTNTFFLISYRAFFTSIFTLIMLFLFLKSIPKVEDILKIIFGSLLGAVGLICMLKAIKNNALQWLGIYNLIGVLIIYAHLYLFEGFTKTPSYMGLAFIVVGYASFLVFNTNKTTKVALKTHVLFLIMIICFSYSSIIHWKNLTNDISPLFIVANQEMVVFIISSFFLLFNFKKEIKRANYQKNVQKVLIMSVLIVVAMYFSFKGIKITDPLIASVLFLANPITTILFSSLFFKERISLIQITAILLISIGAFLIHFQTN